MVFCVCLEFNFVCLFGFWFSLVVCLFLCLLVLEFEVGG